MKKKVIKITFRTRACRRKTEDEVEKRELLKYDSQDSRYFGFVPLKNIIAKASFVIYSQENGFSAARIID